MRAPVPNLIGGDPRIHLTSKKILRRGWMAGSSPAMTSARVPGAMQRVALAKRCFAEPGPRFLYPTATGTPALQRTASQELRAALRPGTQA
jgi:hypothetical protein